MNRSALLAVIAVLSLAFGSACRVAPAAQAGNVTFAWSFYGYRCSQDPDIQSVRVTIPGESLQNNGIYPCSANGSDGIVLYDFAPGTYSYTLDAIDYSGNIIYSGGGTFAVNGNVLVQIDLTPTRQAPSWAHLSWHFPEQSGAARPCDERRVAKMGVWIDDQPPAFLACADGLSDPGVRSMTLAAGSHAISIKALGEDSSVLYSAESTLTTYAGDPVSAHFSLAPPASPQR